jgi:oligosaccharide repeat unit polymerase
MLLVENESKLKRLFWLVILLLDIVFNMMIGARTTGVILAAVLLVYYHFCIKQIKLKQAVVVIVVGYLFVSSFSIIGSVRSDTFASYTQAFAENFGKADAVTSSISEMGGSMFPMLQTMRLVPSLYDYKYGSSYLFSLTSVIPNFGFWDLHPAMKYGNLNAWLQDALHLGYGPGYSIVAEAYINFGKFGCLMMLLLGWVFGKVFNYGEYNKNNPLPFVLSIIFCYLVTSTVRNSFLATVRSIFYYIIPIYVMVVYIKKGKYILE